MELIAACAAIESTRMPRSHTSTAECIFPDGFLGERWVFHGRMECRQVPKLQREGYPRGRSLEHRAKQFIGRLVPVSYHSTSFEWKSEHAGEVIKMRRLYLENVLNYFEVRRKSIALPCLSFNHV